MYDFIKHPQHDNRRTNIFCVNKFKKFANCVKITKKYDLAM